MVLDDDALQAGNQPGNGRQILTWHILNIEEAASVVKLEPNRLWHRRRQIAEPLLDLQRNISGTSHFRVRIFPKIAHGAMKATLTASQE